MQQESGEVRGGFAPQLSESSPALGAVKPPEQLLPGHQSPTRSQTMATLNPSLQLTSPREGQTIRGDLTVQVHLPPGTDLSKLRVEFERWDGRAWRKQAMRDVHRWHLGGRLTVPRVRFGDGGKWRLRVGLASASGKGTTAWREFSFVPGLKQMSPAAIGNAPTIPKATRGTPAAPEVKTKANEAPERAPPMKQPDVKRRATAAPEAQVEKAPEKAAPIKNPVIERRTPEIQIAPSLLTQ